MFATIPSTVRKSVFALVLAVLPVAACAASEPQPFHGSSSESPGDGGGGAATGDDDAPTEPTGMFVVEAGPDMDARAARPQRCDDAGRCTCFNIATLGLPGHTGFEG